MARSNLWAAYGFLADVTGVRPFTTLLDQVFDLPSVRKHWDRVDYWSSDPDTVTVPSDNGDSTEEEPNWEKVDDTASTLDNILSSQYMQTYYKRFEIPQSEINAVREQLASIRKEAQKNALRQAENVEKATTAESGYHAQVVGGQKRHMKDEMAKLARDSKKLKQESVDLVDQEQKVSNKLDVINDIINTPYSEENEGLVRKAASDIGVSVIAKEYEDGYTKPQTKPGDVGDVIKSKVTPQTDSS